MKDPDRGHNDEKQTSNQSDPGFGDALSELTKNLQWEKMLTDGGCSRQTLALTVTAEERHRFLHILKPVARDFALETGVLLPSVSFKDGEKRVLTWGDEFLGELRTERSDELLRLLKDNAWRFLTLRQVEARLKKLWLDRPELYRAFEEVNFKVSRAVRILRDLLKEKYSIKNFAAVMECMILAQSQYSTQSDLFEAIKKDLGLSRSSGQVSEASTKKSNVDLGRESLADEITLEIGRSLVPLVDPQAGETLTKRITSLRQSLVWELGWVVPGVRLRDNLTLQPNVFRILIRDEECFRGEVQVHSWIAIGPENKVATIRGVHTTDPVYNMPAVWVTADLRAECEQKGCVIFTAESVIATALTVTVKANAGRLFSYGYFRDGLLEKLKQDEPSLARVFKDSTKLSRQAKNVFARLLEEGISITNKVTILETIMDAEEQDLSSAALTEMVRKRLGGAICQPYFQQENRLVAFVLSEKLQSLFLECLDHESNVLKPDRHQERKLRQSMKFAIEDLREKGVPEVLITKPELRRPVWELFHRDIPSLVVLSEEEIPHRVEIDCLGEAVARFTRPTAPNPRRQPYPRGRRINTRFRKFRRR